MAIRRERGHSLHMVDFLVENSSGLDTATIDGNTALHYCAIYNQPECAKLLLRSGANMNAENKERKTVADLAKEFGSSECEDLVISSRGHTSGVEKNDLECLFHFTDRPSVPAQEDDAGECQH